MAELAARARDLLRSVPDRGYHESSRLPPWRGDLAYSALSRSLRPASLALSLAEEHLTFADDHGSSADRALSAQFRRAQGFLRDAAHDVHYARAERELDQWAADRGVRAVAGALDVLDDALTQLSSGPTSG